MDAFTPRKNTEAIIQAQVGRLLDAKGWYVVRLIGNAYQSGLPDLYITHPEFGGKLLEIKVYGRVRFTKAQVQRFPILAKYGSPVWILGAHTPSECTPEFLEREYLKLFKPANWGDYITPLDIQQTIKDSLDAEFPTTDAE